jgi:hypothetical protein
MNNSTEEPYVAVREKKFPIGNYDLNLAFFKFDRITEIEGLESADLLYISMKVCGVSKIEGLGHLTDLTGLDLS